MTDRTGDMAALVTGGGRRIGAAIARMLAARGWPVAIHFNRSGDDAEQTAAAIRRDGGQAATVQADLCDPDATAGLIETAAAAVGRPIDCLINNASVFELDRLKDFTAADFDRNMAVHARAPALLAQAMAAQQPAPADGVIVNLLDQKSFNPHPAYFSYTISKYALLGLTQTLALALAPTIRVNGVALGLILPPETMRDARFRELQARTPLGPGAETADVTAAVAYLVDARRVTGETILVDAGEHLGRV